MLESPMPGGRPSDGHSYSPYSAGYASPPRKGYHAEGLGITKVEDLEPKCSLWRYRCPIAEIQDLQSVNSKYSDEFVVADVPWRVHLQQRTDPQTSVMYLAIHLQCVTTQAGGTYGHFKISVVNRDYEKSKGKNFHCHFKKPGSAWGLHHFIQLERLLNSDVGFVERYETQHGEIIPCVVIEILLKVIDPGLDGTYVIGQLPKPSRALHSRPSVNARLQWPDEDFADITFRTVDGEIRAHKCIVASRCPRLMEGEGDAVELPPSINRAVFEMFLKYVYTEDSPEPHMANPEMLIDLYGLAHENEYYQLAEKCLSMVGPLITPHNVLELVLKKRVELERDGTLQIVFLRVLTTHYDQLIEDPRFEEIPGKMNRKMSLIMRSKENLGDIHFPRGSDRTLSADLGALAQQGFHSDIDVVLPGGSTLHLHKIVLRNRAVQTQSWQGASYQFEATDEYMFADETYSAFFSALYRGTIESPHGEPITPELITLTLKMDNELQLTGDLRKECENWVSPQNCLPLYVLSMKHNVPTLAETSRALLARNFMDKLREDSQKVWRLMEELPKAGLLELFRGFTQNIMDTQHRP